MADPKQDIRLIQLNNYIRPKVEENKSRNWVLNGKNNSFYHYLINRYNGSPTNSAIINSYVDMIYGKGIGARNSYTNTQDWIRFKVLLKDSDLRRIVSDFVLFNEFSTQVIKAKNKKDLGAIKHLPKERVAPSIENDEEEIDFYWYCRDWSNINKFKPLEFPAFGTSNDEIEIYNGKPYKAGKTYFADPDYLAGLPYMEMEEEISNYYINHIKNGLSFGYIINIPDGNSLTEEEKDQLEFKIKQKLTGSSNAGKFVLSFNGRDAEITVTPLTVNDAHKQWEYLTSESRQQIMTSHRVVSPMLFGIKDNTGFGNNAEELDTAREQLIKYVIEPKQRFIIEALQEILEYYNINLELYFKPLKEVEVALSDEKKKTDLDEFLELGEDCDIDGYDLVGCKPVDYDEEDKITLSVSTGVAFPNAKSKYDTEFYLYRYRYAGNEAPERDFCRRMMGAGKIYRREDIEAMGEKNVNPGFGMHPTPNKPYSIWKYKGGGLLSASFTGGTCKHYWEKLTYKKKGVKIDVNNPINEPKESKASGIAGIAPHSI
jgi:hypothetical protein